MPIDPTNTTKPKPVTIVDNNGWKRIYRSQQEAAIALGVSYSKLLTLLKRNGKPIGRGKRMGYRVFSGAL